MMQLDTTFSELLGSIYQGPLDAMEQRSVATIVLDDASVELGVSRNTTRTHLRSLFAKTGVIRQSMLVRLILKSVAPLAWETQ